MTDGTPLYRPNETGKDTTGVTIHGLSPVNLAHRILTDKAHSDTYANLSDEERARADEIFGNLISEMVARCGVIFPASVANPVGRQRLLAEVSGILHTPSSEKEVSPWEAVQTALRDLITDKVNPTNIGNIPSKLTTTVITYASLFWKNTNGINDPDAFFSHKDIRRSQGYSDVRSPGMPEGKGRTFDTKGYAGPQPDTRPRSRRQ